MVSPDKENAPDCPVVRFGSLFLCATFLLSQSSCGLFSEDDKSKKERNILEKTSAQQGLVRIVEETSAGEYRITDEYPSTLNDGANVIVNGLDGKTTIYTEDDLKKMAESEELRQGHGSGSGLTRILLAGAVGAMIGGMAAKWAGSGNPDMYRDDRAYRNSQQTVRVLQQRGQGKYAGLGGAAAGGPTNPKSGFFSSSGGGETRGSSASFGA